MKVYATNKRVKYDYEILEKFEAGLALKGYEVKSIKNGRMSLKGAYVTIKNNEAYLLNASIAPYQPKNIPKDYNPSQSRKLLLHKKEINYLIGKNKEKRLTLVPIKVYTKKDKLKLEVGIGKGKKKRDKREQIKKREVQREIERIVKH